MSSYNSSASLDGLDATKLKRIPIRRICSRDIMLQALKSIKRTVNVFLITHVCLIVPNKLFIGTVCLIVPNKLFKGTVCLIVPNKLFKSTVQ